MTFLSSDSNKLVSRSWNGTPISRRTTDGYVNATAMAKASGKQWSHYRETDRASTYLEALSTNTGIRVAALYIAKPGEGTWIHPRLAVDFARWISAEFAVWMDEWFWQELEAKASQVRDTQPVYPALSPLETAERTLALVRSITSLYCELGGIDERDQLLFKDIARNQLLKLTTGSVPALPSDDEMTLSDAWMEVFQQVLPRTQYKSAGTLVANAYREDFGTEPPKRQQFVDGAPRQVKSYRRSWLVETLSKFKSQLAGA